MDEKEEWKMTQKKEQKKEKSKETNCDFCAYYMYDEDYDEYVCDVNMDEDDFAKLSSREFRECPYYRNGDEYAVVRHQI